VVRTAGKNAKIGREDAMSKKQKEPNLSARAIANRKNALKSTGPRTDAGKAISRQNSIRHGLLASKVVVPGFEDRQEFEAFSLEMAQTLLPVGPLESRLCEEITSCFWRLERARKFEASEIRKAKESLSMQGVTSVVVQRPLPRVEHLSDDELEHIIRAFHERQPVTNAFDHSIHVLRQVQALLQEGKNLSDTLWQELAEIDPSGAISQRIRKDAHFATDVVASRVSKLEAIRNASIKEAGKLEEAVDGLSLADFDTLEKVLRYETAITRKLYQAMAQLERLQRRRKGEEVPVPLEVQVKL
jgi:hypothetical protein